MATHSTGGGFLVLASLLQLVQPSYSRFVFQFQLHAVTTNPTAECDTLGDGVCETYLNRFCLRETGSSRSNADDSDCPLGSSDPRFGPNADDTLPVSRTIFSGPDSLWRGSFQMFIRAYDEDPGILLDDLLDNIFIEMQLAENDDFTAIDEFTGVMNKVSVNMTFRVRMCPDNLFGENCDVMCIAQNDSTNGYYTCNGDGSIQCRFGFRNVSNYCRDLDPCASMPCANNGNCTVIGPQNFTCECTPGYTGPTCDEEVDPCLTVTCPYNSVCVRNMSDAHCVCSSGLQLIGGLCVVTPTSTVSDEPGVNNGQVGSPVIIGSAAGGGVLLIVVLLLLAVVIGAVLCCRRTKSGHDKMTEHVSFSPDHKDTVKLEMTSKKSNVKREDSMEDNCFYNQISPIQSPNHPPKQQESSMSDSNIPNMHDMHTSEASVSVAHNPVYGSGVNQTFSDSSPRPQRSTIRQIQNPVYGDPFERNNTDEGVYSTPQPPTQSSRDDDTEQPEYSYAMVQASVSGAATQLDQEKNGTLQSTPTAIVENVYAVVDQAANTHSVASNASLPYSELKHEQTGATSDQGKLQTDHIRLAEDESLGYSALT